MREAGDPAYATLQALRPQRAVVAHTENILLEHFGHLDARRRAMLLTWRPLDRARTRAWVLKGASAHPDDVPDAVHLLFALMSLGRVVFFPLFCCSASCRT